MADLVAKSCDCDCGTKCPQGKVGSAARCTIMVVPTSGNELGKAVRRLVLFDRAKDAMGGARKLGKVIGIGRRSVNHRLVADRTLTDGELAVTADAIEARARELDQLAADIRKVIA